MLVFGDHSLMVVGECSVFLVVGDCSVLLAVGSERARLVIDGHLLM